VDTGLGATTNYTACEAQVVAAQIVD